MSLATQIQDAGGIQILADDIVRLATRAQALQASGGSYTPPEDSDITYVLSPAQRQAYTDKLAAKWTALKALAARN